MPHLWVKHPYQGFLQRKHKGNLLMNIIIFCRNHRLHDYTILPRYKSLISSDRIPKIHPESSKIMHSYIHTVVKKHLLQLIWLISHYLQAFIHPNGGDSRRISEPSTVRKRGCLEKSFVIDPQKLWLECAWMSQEDSKWWVTGIKSQYTRFISR